ncbi:MAG: VirK/YbjX family protein [Cetobacterium sp.]|nr:VirK/YbjX family protein [Cetobacterium sp.]
MINIFIFCRNVIKKGKNKGQLNTCKKKWKFYLRSLLLFPYTKKYLNFLKNHKYLKKAIYNYPILLSKLHRPYLILNNPTKSKMNNIIDNYLFIDEFFPKNIKESLYKIGKVQLGNIIGKNDNKFKVTLNLYPVFDKEGELNIKLLDYMKNEISTVTFSFVKINDVYSIIIGGLQGPKNLDKEYVKECSKSLYGLFPKRIVIESLYFLEKALNYPLDKFAVGNNSHIYTALRYKSNRTILADYDSFWESFEAIKMENNLWKFPKTLEKKSLEDIPSKKRSQFIKKQNLLNTLENEILVKFL